MATGVLRGNLVENVVGHFKQVLVLGEDLLSPGVILATGVNDSASITLVAGPKLPTLLNGAQCVRHKVVISGIGVKVVFGHLVDLVIAHCLAHHLGDALNQVVLVAC